MDRLVVSQILDHRLFGKLWENVFREVEFDLIWYVGKDDVIQKSPKNFYLAGSRN